VNAQVFGTRVKFARVVGDVQVHLFREEDHFTRLRWLFVVDEDKIDISCVTQQGISAGH
jgi:hypothetical protein